MENINAVQITEDFKAYEARTAPQRALMLSAIDSLDAAEFEKANLRFYGDWDLDTVTAENAASLATETLGYLRAELAEDDRDCGSNDGNTLCF